jgi:23S rRNA (adenine2503-C2)-methyltransferase
MNCSFCFTGTQGLKRSLKTEEIIGQYLKAQEWLLSNRPDDSWISNIVFMGQGEPLHNFESVKAACQIFTSQHGFSIGPQKITVSTSGYKPGLLKWLDRPLGVNLALSLHSTQASIRNELIPINKKYPLDDVLKIIDQIPLQNKQFVTYEYLLVDDLNDSTDDAHQLGELLHLKRALINLIPFNPFPGSKYKRPKLAKIENFKRILDGYKVPTMIRSTKGDQVLAACGQLNTK